MHKTNMSKAASLKFDQSLENDTKMASFFARVNFPSHFHDAIFCNFLNASQSDLISIFAKP